MHHRVLQWRRTDETLAFRKPHDTAKPPRNRLDPKNSATSSRETPTLTVPPGTCI